MFAEPLTWGFGPTVFWTNSSNTAASVMDSSTRGPSVLSAVPPSHNSVSTKTTDLSLDLSHWEFGAGHGAGLQLICNNNAGESAVVISTGGGSGGGVENATHGGGGGGGVQVFLPLNVTTLSGSNGGNVKATILGGKSGPGLLSSKRWLKFSTGGGGGCGTVSKSDFAKLTTAQTLAKVNKTADAELNIERKRFADFVASQEVAQEPGSVSDQADEAGFYEQAIQVNKTISCGMRPDHHVSGQAPPTELIQQFLAQECTSLYIHGGGGGGGGGVVPLSGEHDAMSKVPATIAKNPVSLFRLGYGFFFYADVSGRSKKPKIGDVGLQSNGKVTKGREEEHVDRRQHLVEMQNVLPHQSEQLFQDFDYSPDAWKTVLTPAEFQELEKHVKPKSGSHTEVPSIAEMKKHPKYWWHYLPPQALESMLQRKQLEAADAWKYISVAQPSESLAPLAVNEGLLFTNDTAAWTYLDHLRRSAAAGSSSLLPLSFLEQENEANTQLLIENYGRSATVENFSPDYKTPTVLVKINGTAMGMNQRENFTAAALEASNQTFGGYNFTYLNGDVYEAANEIVMSTPPRELMASQGMSTLTVTTWLFLDLYPEPFNAGCLVFLAAFLSAFIGNAIALRWRRGSASGSDSEE
ncbi:unnamed protein product [Amoebophrya sp. A120]|nr:unnamed protein product [Amoebophrya sp. A120]|eukprot:GSA120T00005154001.1